MSSEKFIHRIDAETRRCLDGLWKMIGKDYFYPRCLSTVQENLIILKDKEYDQQIIKEFETSLSEWQKVYQSKKNVQELKGVYAIYHGEYPDDEYYYILDIMREKEVEKMLTLFTVPVKLPDLKGTNQQIMWANELRALMMAEFLEAISMPNVEDRERKYDEKYIEDLQWQMQTNAIIFLEHWTNAKDYINRRWYGARIHSLLIDGK